jgi:hypothetical protein
MPDRIRVVLPGPAPGTVRADDGAVLRPPADWALLPPGDAAVTRRVKAGGPYWAVEEKRGRKVFSKGVWAPADRVERAKQSVAREKASPEYARRLEAGRRRRATEQEQYAGDFERAVLAFLAFAPRHRALAERLAKSVAAHATPVGSGTVARTQRIPLMDRAEAAVIAWLRHQTTTYDLMSIARVKGARREVRRELARRSRALLERYRDGRPVEAATCPLLKALASPTPVPVPGAGEEE